MDVYAICVHLIPLGDVAADCVDLNCNFVHFFVRSYLKRAAKIADMVGAGNMFFEPIGHREFDKYSVSH